MLRVVFVAQRDNLVLLHRAHVHRNVWCQNVIKCLTTSKKLANNSNYIIQLLPVLKRKQIQWARLLGKREEGSLVRKSWTMVSNARHLTCDNKVWQSNEDKPPGQDQNYWPLIKAIQCIANIVAQQTKAPDTAICAQGLWNQHPGMSTILTRFRRVPLGREHPEELFTDHKTSWRNILDSGSYQLSCDDYCHPH